MGRESPGAKAPGCGEAGLHGKGRILGVQRGEDGGAGERRPASAVYLVPPLSPGLPHVLT